MLEAQTKFAAEGQPGRQSFVQVIGRIAVEGGDRFGDGLLRQSGACEQTGEKEAGGGWQNDLQSRQGTAGEAIQLFYNLYLPPHPVARAAPTSLHCEHVSTLRWVRFRQVASLRSSPAKTNKTR